MDDLKNIFQAIVNTCKKTPKHSMSVQNITNALKYLCQRLREDLIIRPPPKHKKLLFNPNDRKATLHIRNARKQN